MLYQHGNDDKSYNNDDDDDKDVNVDNNDDTPHSDLQPRTNKRPTALTRATGSGADDEHMHAHADKHTLILVCIHLREQPIPPHDRLASRTANTATFGTYTTTSTIRTLAVCILYQNGDDHEYDVDNNNDDGDNDRSDDDNENRILFDLRPKRNKQTNK